MCTIFKSNIQKYAMIPPKLQASVITQIGVDSSGVHAECPESGQNYIALYSVCTQCLVNLSLFRIEYPLDCI